MNRELLYLRVNMVSDTHIIRQGKKCNIITHILNVNKKIPVQVIFPVNLGRWWNRQKLPKFSHVSLEFVGRISARMSSLNEEKESQAFLLHLKQSAYLYLLPLHRRTSFGLCYLFPNGRVCDSWSTENRFCVPPPKCVLATTVIIGHKNGNTIDSKLLNNAYKKIKNSVWL